MDRIDSIAVFAEVAERGSFSGAAKHLNRSAAAVTRAVAELETRLGVRLLNRTTRAVSVTEAGQRFLGGARRVLADLAEIEQGAAGQGQAPRGELRVTAPIVFGRRHVLPLVTDFLKRYPEVSVRLALLDPPVGLGLGRRPSGAGELREQLVELLTHLGHRPVQVGPVVPDRGGAPLRLPREQERGQRLRDVVEHTAPPLLLGLDRLPPLAHAARGSGLGLAEDVRVAPHELVVDGARDAVEIALPPGFSLENAEQPNGGKLGQIGEFKITMAITDDKAVFHHQRVLTWGNEHRLYFPASAYPALKAAFDDIHKADNHTITLRKD